MEVVHHTIDSGRWPPEYVVAQANMEMSALVHVARNVLLQLNNLGKQCETHCALHTGLLLEELLARVDNPPTIVVLLGVDPSGQDVNRRGTPSSSASIGGNSDGSSSSDDGGVNAGNTVTGLTSSSTKSSAITGII